MNLRTSQMLMVAFGLPIAVVILFALVRLFEPQFAFFPMAHESVTPREFGVDSESVTVWTRDGDWAAGRSLAARGTSRDFHATDSAMRNPRFDGV
jgi:hypothetical protein